MQTITTNQNTQAHTHTHAVPQSLHKPALPPSSQRRRTRHTDTNILDSPAPAIYTLSVPGNVDCVVSLCWSRVGCSTAGGLATVLER